MWHRDTAVMCELALIRTEGTAQVSVMGLYMWQRQLSEHWHVFVDPEKSYTEEWAALPGCYATAEAAQMAAGLHLAGELEANGPAIGEPDCAEAYPRSWITVEAIEAVYRRAVDGDREGH